jgi:2-iminobutanoate/2-iminopropanoate deaminase
MEKLQIKHPDRKASTGAYSDGILVDGWLYVAGQGPLDLSNGEVIAGTIEKETRVTLENVGKILAAGGCGFADVVKSTVHLADIKDFDRFNTTYAEFFEGIRPVRTTVQSVLALGIKVEIDVVAKVPSKKG